jgi:hypothetical protein
MQYGLFAPHTTPQPPQLVTSAARSMHVPPQLVLPGAQQSPVVQTVPSPHTLVASALPQPPQLFSPIMGSTQRASHFNVEPAQMSSHLLPLHCSPTLHVVPQPPQLKRSLVMFAQYAALDLASLALSPPSAASASRAASALASPSLDVGAQVTKFAAHVTLHAPLEQTAPASQILPQPPQLVLSVAVSAQRDPHTVVCAGQCSLHAPELQSSSAPQALSHEPQCCASRLRSAQIAPHTVCVEPHRTVDPVSAVDASSFGAPVSVDVPPSGATSPADVGSDEHAAAVALAANASKRHGKAWRVIFKLMLQGED